jgi:hypothetical protein
MNIPEAAALQHTVAALRTPILGRGSLFRACILGATLAPFLTALAIRFEPQFVRHAPGALQAPLTLSIGTAFAWMGIISSAHVVSTSYLLLNPKEYYGVWKPWLSLVCIPLTLLAATFVVLLSLPLGAVLAYMIVYLHYGMWHFGRQNLGVLSFVTRVSLARPMNGFERRTIMAGVIAGISATYTVFAPAFGLSEKAFPFDLSNMPSVMSVGWHVGAIINAVLVPTTLWYAYRHRKEYDWLTLTTYLASVFFFLPIFLTSEPLFALAAWSIAHGLQYIVFLTFHAAGKPRPLRSAVALAAAVTGGIVIWQLAASAQVTDDISSIKLWIAVITGATLVHYWVDQFLWRFNNPDRRKWMAENCVSRTGPCCRSPPACEDRIMASNGAIAPRWITNFDLTTLQVWRLVYRTSIGRGDRLSVKASKPAGRLRVADV